jgi:hypothetical protein
MPRVSPCGLGIMVPAGLEILPENKHSCTSREHSEGKCVVSHQNSNEEASEKTFGIRVRRQTILLKSIVDSR